MLSAFSYQGGIERFNRAFLYAMHTLSESHKINVTAVAVHDKPGTTLNYFPSHKIKQYKGYRGLFSLLQCFRLFKDEVWIMGHINLAPLGVIRKIFAPSRQLVLVCHGLEVFSALNGWKKKVLNKADRILAVSHFTKNILISQHNVPEEKITVFPNTIDPFFHFPEKFQKPLSLLNRYGIKEGESILFTLTRMNSEESYKGYDQVLHVLPGLLREGYRIKYLLAGKADEKEYNRILNLISELDLEEQVILTGFIADQEITDHYLLADLFVMPSKGEGFGIVFLEAMACGVPVIAGNKDGSTEALQFGKLGKLVNPDKGEEISAAIKDLLQNRPDSTRLQSEMLSYFSFDQYLSRTKSFLYSLN